MAVSPTTAVTDTTAHGLLIFDGDCGFCTTSAQWLAERAGEAVTVAPWQALELSDYGLTEQDTSTAFYWVQDGWAHRGADGVGYALRACRSPWPMVGKAVSVPPLLWIARAIYPLIAKYRYKLPGATNACRIPQ